LILKGSSNNHRHSTAINWQGGAGLDTLVGGSGADAFQFQGGDFSGNSRKAADWIWDFSQADGDKIDLGLVDANTAIAGNQAFTFIGSSAFSHSAGQLRYEVVTVNNLPETIVYGDTNGDGLADFAMRLTSGLSLSNSDFIL
jgi:serralysin